MTTLGDIFRHYGPSYRAQFGEQMLPSQHAAMQAIEQCRTEALGGQIYSCPACGTRRYSYHSCRNRHCPRCQHDAAQSWLESQQELLLPVPYFLITFTLPSELREITYRHQRTLYNLLFRASAAALMQLARDPRFLGAQIGMLGVLQTWTRDLRYHPHVHYLVPGGGLAEDGRTWVTAKADFLVHVKPLAALFRAKLRSALRQSALWSEIPAAAWQQPWVVDCRPVGTAHSALKYLAPYIFRVALSNNRIVSVADEQVTFRYTASESGRTAYCTLPVQEFIGRFLQDVLPKGLVKVRYYGLFRVGKRRSLARLRSQLLVLQHIALPPTLPPASSEGSRARLLVCPSCGEPMRLERVLLPHNRGPPSRAADGLRQQPSLRWRCVEACHVQVCLVCCAGTTTSVSICNSGCAECGASADKWFTRFDPRPWTECMLRDQTSDHHRAAFGRSLPDATPT